MDASPKAITIAILAMGGEGGGVLSDWIVDLAEHAGYDVQATSVPGVAQRTGSTIYYVEIFPRVAGKEPVLALMPVPGELDVVIASELMEAGRALERGFVTPNRTTLIASTHRVYSMTEKTAVGDGRVDAEKILEACRESARSFIGCDFARIAQDSGSVISAALFGALASTRALPFDRAGFEDAIRRGGVGVEASLAAFTAGFENAPDASEEAPDPRIGARLQAARASSALEAKVVNDFPAASHEILLAAIGRLADYQDERYAADYLDRLAPIRDVSRSDVLLLKETARHLALWMSYEDAIRVAGLKIRRARFDRIGKDVRAASGQLLQIREFLHPRPQEIADILPPAFSRWILGSRAIRRLTRNGRIVHTTSVSGFLQLYLLAALRPLRRKSMRFEREQRKIADWLRTVAQIASEDCALAVEVAQCPRLMKGYGDTHALGSRKFDEVMAALPGLRGTTGAAARLRELREAALSSVEA